MSNEKSHLPNWLAKFTHGLLREPKTQAELLELLNDAQSRSLINTDALHQIESIIEFSKLTVSDVMLPRGQMITVEANASVQSVLPVIIDSAHSRFPVFNENHDEIIGILLAKDILPILMSQNTENTTVDSIMRAPIFAPESKHLDALLNEFRSKHAHMAIAVDEYGTIAGLITIEDILEEIVGDIIDETDPDKQQHITKIDDQTFQVDALIPIDDFNAYFKTNFSDMNHDTLAGLICEKAGSLPKVEEVINLNGFTCEILSRNERRLTKIKVQKIDHND